ncbi:DUF4197 domain-containing protein [Novosphingobium silvae]
MKEFEMGNWGSCVDEAFKSGLGRRTFLGGIMASAALALPGCATLGRPSETDVIERLMLVSTQRAFARLTQPDGFWDSTVARIDLPVLFGKPGSRVAKVLKSPLFRERLQHELNTIAEDGARVAAPLVYDAVRGMTVSDALAILRGGDTAATTFLRQSMGASLVNAMIPELGRVMQATEDPLLNQAISALAGVNIGDAAHALALAADNAIWYEIGAQEGEIRRNPESTNDPMLIGALKAL